MAKADGFAKLDNPALLIFITLWLQAQKDPRNPLREDSVKLAILGKGLKLEAAKRLKAGTLTVEEIQDATK